MKKILKCITFLLLIVLCLCSRETIAYNNIASAFGSTEINGN